MKIATWNINGRDTGTVTKGVVDTIRNCDADLIILTEVPFGMNENDWEYLMEMMRKKRYEITAPNLLIDIGNSKKGIVIIAKDSFNIVYTDYNINDCNMLLIKGSYENKSISIIGARMETGWENCRKQYDSEKEALDEILIPKVRECAESTDICIVAGDFNNACCHGNLNKKYKREDYLAKDGSELDQINYNLNIIKDVMEESAGLTMADINNGKPIMTFINKNRFEYPLDHIFVKGHKKICKVTTEYSSYSDHYLLIVEIEL